MLVYVLFRLDQAGRISRRAIRVGSQADHSGSLGTFQSRLRAMVKSVGYQVIYNGDSTGTESLLFWFRCPSCGEAFLASRTAFEPVIEKHCPRCCWAFELARCCDSLRFSDGIDL
jgi:hypothetical protein